MTGALLFSLGLGVSTLGYQGTIPSAGLDFELTSHSKRTQLVSGLTYYSARKIGAGGYALSGDIALRRFIGPVLVELGGEVIEQRTDSYSKRGLSPVVGLGFRRNGFLTALRYHGSDGTENELQGLSVRVEMTERRWRPYASIGFWDFKTHQGAKDAGMTAGLGLALRVTGGSK